MSEATERHQLPLLQSGQSQKEVTHNEALVRLDALLHLAVESRAASVPPALPATGATWIVAAGATGDWSGQEGRIAHYHAGGWTFIKPCDGSLAWVKDEGVFAYRSAGEWSTDAWPVKALRIDGRRMLAADRSTIANPQGGSVIDVEARSRLAEVLAVLRAQGLIDV